MRLRLCMALALVAALAGVSIAETNLTGAGATFPYPMYSKWFDEYHNQHKDIKINYQSIGSGGGIKQIQAGTVDFGASDGPMTDERHRLRAKFSIFQRSSALTCRLTT